MLNWYNTRALCTVLKALPNNFIFGAFSLDGQDLSLTFIVMFSRKVAKHWRYIVHLCHSEYEMQHTSRVYPRTKQPGTAMGVSTIHLSELSKLLLLFYTACPCLLLRYKATISFVMSVCLSVWPSACMELGSQWKDFHEVWHLSIFSHVCPPAWNSPPNGRIFHEIWYLSIFFQKSVEKIQVSLKSDKNKGHFTSRPIYIFVHTSLSFLEWKMFRTKVVVKIGTHFSSVTFFFRKSCRLCDNVEKYCTALQATEDKMAHAQCMLDT